MSTNPTTVKPRVYGRINRVKRVVRLDLIDPFDAIEELDILSAVFGDRSGHVTDSHRLLHDALARTVTTAA